MHFASSRFLAILFATMGLHASVACFHDDGGTGPTPVGISADTVFWRAYADPTTFDSWLATQTVDRDASACLRRRAQTLFAASEAKLRDCGQMVSFTPEWNRCHDESENLHNGGVVANDIAQAVDRIRPFSVSDGGRVLTFVRSTLGVADWNAFITTLRQSFPPITC
jgi:hypothetical protein